jgi:hypothetical protein
MFHTKAPRKKRAIVRDMAINKIIISIAYSSDSVTSTSFFFDTILTARVLKPTTLMLLIGISIAATSGVKFPETAMLNVMKL